MALSGYCSSVSGVSQQTMRRRMVSAYWAASGFSLVTCAARLSAGAVSAWRLALRMPGVSSRLMGPTLSFRATKALLAAS